MFGSSRDTRTKEKWLMKLNFVVETSRPSEATFSLSAGMTIPMVLVLTVISLIAKLF